MGSSCCANLPSSSPRLRRTSAPARAKRVTEPGGSGTSPGFGASDAARLDEGAAASEILVAEVPPARRKTRARDAIGAHGLQEARHFEALGAQQTNVRGERLPVDHVEP